MADEKSTYVKEIFAKSGTDIMGEQFVPYMKKYVMSKNVTKPPDNVRAIAAEIFGNKNGKENSICMCKSQELFDEKVKLFPSFQRIKEFTNDEIKLKDEIK